jgi:serine/threonine protein kinase
MIRAIAETEESQELNEILNHLRKEASRYSDIQICEKSNKNAGTKACFVGKDGKRDVMFTTEKKPKNQIARHVRDNGYGLINEIGIAREFGLEEAIENHLAVHFDSFESNRNLVAVAPKIDAIPLKEYVKEGEFSFKEFSGFFRQAISTQRFLKNKGIYHGDFSPYNLLVKQNGKLEAWVTDLGSASKINEANLRSAHTLGARTIEDPNLFFRKGSRYNDSSEIYALAQNMLVALNGEPAVKYDHINGRGESFEGENLIENGKWNEEKHNKAIKSAIKKLPRWARKRYGKMVYKAMASSGNYNTLEEFQVDFEKASKLSLLTRLRTETSAKLAAGGLAAVLALAGTGIPMLQEHYSKNLEAAVAEASKYVVATKFNGSELQLVNNLLDLELSIWSREEHPRVLYSKEKKPDYISLSRGQLVSVSTAPQEKPRPEGNGLAMPHFKGKLYIEGYPGEKFFTDSIMPDPSKYEDFGPNLAYFDFKVPDDIPDGNYTLVAELYAQDKPNPPNHYDALERIKYEDPGKAINRKRIPIVIGNPRDKLHWESLRLDYSTFIDFANMEKEPLESNPNLMGSKRIGPNITYEFSIPEIGFKGSEYVENHGLGSHHSPKIRIPSPKDTIEKTLQLVVKQEDRVLGYTFIPIRGNDIARDGSFYWWEVCPPGPEFSDKLIKYREAIYQEK